MRTRFSLALATLSLLSLMWFGFDRPAHSEQVIPGSLRYNVTTLTYAASKAIDFTNTPYQTLAVTGNITFTSANLGAGRGVSVRLVADSSPRTLTFPGGWKFLGAAAPASLAANKTAVLSLVSFGTADVDVVAAYSVQP